MDLISGSVTRITRDKRLNLIQRRPEAGPQSVKCPVCGVEVPDGARFGRFWSHFVSQHAQMIKEISGSEERLKFVNSHWETALSEIKRRRSRSILDETKTSETGSFDELVERFKIVARPLAPAIHRSALDQWFVQGKEKDERAEKARTKRLLLAPFPQGATQTRTLSRSPTHPSPYPPPLLDRRVRGVVDHLSINAVPDTGADESFISANLLKRLKYHNRHRPSNLGTEIQQYEFDHLPPVQLASGKTVCSTTIATIPWRFEGESRIDWLVCRVLPTLTHDLILGDRFLRCTKTLTTFKHRVVTTVRSVAGGGLRMVRMLNYMGQNKRRLWGYLDGALVTALPDSGSDIVAISAEYARQRGFGFDMSPGKQVLVQFADGSMARTDGVVEGLKWVFGAGGQSVISDFYVLRDLPVDVLFSSDFVFDHDVFRRHKWSFYRDENSLDMLLCNIRLMSQRRFKRNPSNKENEEDLFDVTSPEAFSPIMIQRELARRDAIRDNISALPAAEQALAQQAEAERQRVWEHWRMEHMRRWADIAAPEPGASISTSPQGSKHDENLGMKGFKRVGRWARRSLKVVSIPLVPLKTNVVEVV